MEQMRPLLILITLLKYSNMKSWTSITTKLCDNNLLAKTRATHRQLEIGSVSKKNQNKTNKKNQTKQNKNKH